MNRKERQRQAAEQRRAGQVTDIMPGSALAKSLEAGARLQAEGRLPEALQKFESAVALAGDHPRPLLELSNVQRMLDQPAKAAMNLRKALRAAPRTAELAANLGATLRDMDQLEDAANAFEKAAQWKPSFYQAFNELGVTLQLLEQAAKARTAFEQSLALEKRQPTALANLALVHMELGAPGAALEVLETCAKIDPRYSPAFALRAYALQELGREEEARTLMGVERLVVPHAIDAPAGYDNLQAFNEELVEAVVGHPSLQHQPNQRTTRKGQQTGELNREKEGPIAALIEALDAQVTLHLQELPLESEHPFLGVRPKTWRLSLWGTILAEGGHQAPHTHPQAWVSGAYYAQLPDTIRSEDSEHAGWIEFGRAPDSFVMKTEQHVSVIQPTEGTVVLFPSYMYHRTIPLVGDARRVSIAVDVIPLT